VVSGGGFLVRPDTRGAGIVDTTVNVNVVVCRSATCRRSFHVLTGATMNVNGFLAATGTQTQSLTKADGGTLSLNGPGILQRHHDRQRRYAQPQCIALRHSPSEYDLRQP